MRLVQVAKALGMTGQQLRKELLSVDFGIKPTDREVPEGLAQGIIRYIAGKHGITVNTEFLQPGADIEGEEGSAAEQESPAPQASPSVAEAAPEQRNADALHVLRKLTLDDVPQKAIDHQAQQMRPLSKQEREARQQEEKLMSPVKRRQQAQSTERQEQIKRKEGLIALPAQISVKELAEKTGIQIPQVMQALLKNGVMVTITQSIDYDTAAIIAADLGVFVEREQSSASAEALLSKNLEELIKDEPENLLPRPPIVVVMGHVDHGKTSILDAIRKTDVAGGESGGITQHIGAYQVIHLSGNESKAITFLDTPGHEAFTAMRARGAQVTDIAVLVVSAEEGVKETTVEAINHAKEAGVPIIVAINKIDRPNAEPDRVKSELAAHGLQPEEWGGTTPFVLCSALTKQGIPELLEAILVVAEIEGCTANPHRPSVATVIESHLDPALGALATVVVNTGTLHVTDAFVCGKTAGKVRSMTDAHNKRLEQAPPSSPVRVSGFDAVPKAGDILQVVSSEREARDLLKQILDQSSQQQKRGFADLVSLIHEGKVPQLKIVLKADTQGSLEALQASLGKQGTENVQVKIIHGGIGAVSESDVMMAAASEALILAFRVNVPSSVARTAEREGISVKEYEVIYALLEDVQGLLTGLLIPEEQETVYGHLEVKGVFLRKKQEQIIGGRVTDGLIKRLQFRLQRNAELIGTGRITSLRRADNDIKEAKEGSECGMRVESAVNVEVGDVLEVFAKEYKKKASV